MGWGEGRPASPRSALIPAGTYVVGDPCYAVPDDRWMPWLEAANYEKADLLVARVNSWSTQAAVAVSTAVGDGCYKDRKEEFEYGVDAGLLGVVPMSDADRARDAVWRRACKVVEFHSPFRVWRGKHGVVHIGDIEIPTDWEHAGWQR